MRINCPHCGNKFRFLDLYLFRLKGYQIKCRKCGTIFQLAGYIDQLGILLFAFLAMGFLAMFGFIFKTISKHFEFSSTVEALIITFMIVLILAFIIYGHSAYLAWNIRRKYMDNDTQMGNHNDE